MIENFEKDCTIDFTNNRFILINDKYQSEQVISIHQVEYFRKQGFRLTDIAKNELEEAQYQEAINHYLGVDEAYSQTNRKA